MIDVVQQRNGCLYEIRQKGQRDPCYVVVPDTKVRFIFQSVHHHTHLVLFF